MSKFCRKGAGPLNRTTQFAEQVDQKLGQFFKPALVEKTIETNPALDDLPIKNSTPQSAKKKENLHWFFFLTWSWFNSHFFRVAVSI